MTLHEVSASSLTFRPSLITMASSCMFVGTIGVKKSSSETLADKNFFWKHEVYVALPAGDYVANMFTYGGPNSTATPNGIHFVSARVVIENVETVTGPPTVLQLYAVCVRKIFAHPFLRLNGFNDTILDRLQTRQGTWS